MASRSRWLVGSSRRRMSGLPNSACARSTLTFAAPGRSGHLCVVILGRKFQDRLTGWQHRIRHSSRPCLQILLQVHWHGYHPHRKIFFHVDGIFSFMMSYRRLFPMITVSSTVYSSYLKWSCCRKDRRCPGVMTMSPLVGSNCPERIFKNVDFPAPFCTDQSITVAFCKLDIYIFKQCLLSYTKGNIIRTYHVIYLSYK